MSTYVLSLDKRGLGADQDVQFSNASPVTVTFKDRKMTLTLYGVSFCRKMYQPGNIEAEVLITCSTPQTQPIDQDLLQSMLLHRPVALYVESTLVASKYFIHGILPQSSVSNVKVTDADGNEVDGYQYTIYVKLDIYSMDLLLTLNPFSKAYLGKALTEEIVKDTLNDFNLNFSYPDDNNKDTHSQEKLELDSDHLLTNLAYIEDGQRIEFLQPYLVQYNESFYDFIKRVANRCGEALYFEDGGLCLGLPAEAEDKTKVKSSYQLDDVSRVIYHRIGDNPISVSDYARDSANVYQSSEKLATPKEYNSEETSRGSDGYPSDSFSKENFTYNSELAAQEHYILLYKNKFARDTGERFKDHWWDEPITKGVSWLEALLNSTSILELLSQLAVGTEKSGMRFKLMTDAANKKGGALIDEYILDSKNTYATLFTKVDDSLSHWLTLSRYSSLRSSQESQMRKMICADMGAGFSGVKLGDLITLTGDANTYVVVQIDMASPVAWQKSYLRFIGENANPTAINYQYIYAIPLDGTTFYPPLLPGPLFRESASQLAFVTDNEDPKGQGRVRVRFAWQPWVKSFSSESLKKKKKKKDKAQKEMNDAKKQLEKVATDVSYSVVQSNGSTRIKVNATQKSDASDADFKSRVEAYKTACEEFDKAYANWKHDRDKYLTDSTPWIRMVTPMATEGCGGVFFRPEVGDEVMVNFEQGNVDHPYVEGTLFSKNTAVPNPGIRNIVSRNGHTLRFLDPDDASLLAAGSLPALKLLKSYSLNFLPDLSDTDAVVQKALGGIEFTDQYGFYHVTMSSHDRQIAISCPLGDVKIDAFSGISLSAPNGNIRISGKNVEIKAGNKLTITSGGNIKEGGYFNSNFASAVVNSVVGNFFDLSVLRNIVEVFARPVDGTLEVKSNRYLLLEAGKGKARPQDPDAYRKPEKWTPGDDVQPYDEVQAFMDLIRIPDKLVDDLADEFIKYYNSLRNSYLSFKAICYGAQPVFTQPRNADAFFQKVYAWDFGDYTLSRFNQVFDRETNTDNFKLAPRAATINRQALQNRVTEVAKQIAQMKQFLTNRYPDALDEVHSQSVDELDLTDFFAGAKTILEMENPLASATVSNDLRTAPVSADPVSIAKMGMYGKLVKPLKEFLSGRGVCPFDQSLMSSEFKEWKKAVKRRLVSYVIEKCYDGALNKPFDSFAVKYQYKSLKPNNMKFPFQDGDWTNYLNAVKFKPVLSVKERIQSSGLVTALVGKLKQAIPIESRVWNSTAKGKIILSETPTESMAIKWNSGQFEQYKTPFNADERSDKELNTKALDTQCRIIFKIYS